LLLYFANCCIIIIFYPRQSLFSEHTRIQHVTILTSDNIETIIELFLKKHGSTLSTRYNNDFLNAKDPKQYDCNKY